MIVEDKHYRVWDMSTNCIVMSFYDFPGRSTRQNLDDALKARGIQISGYYRIDRMVFQDGVLYWQVNQVAVEIR